MRCDISENREPDSGGAAPTPAPGKYLTFQPRTAFAITVGMLVFVRVAWIAVLPDHAISFDLRILRHLCTMFDRGQNPFLEPWVAWPPEWPTLLWVFNQCSHLFHVPVIDVIRGFLVICDALTAWLVWRITGSVRTAFYGVALNPISILLTTQHGNSDGLLGLYVLAFAFALARGRWLMACLFVGLGIWLRTVPLILVPLLFLGWRQRPTDEKWTGAWLAFGPTAISLGLLYILFPAPITEHVLKYQGSGNQGAMVGWVVILEHAGLADYLRWTPVLQTIFVICTCCWLVGFTGWCARRESMPSPAWIYAATAFSLLWPKVWGTAFGYHHIGWFLPCLVVLAGWGWRRRTLMACYVVVAASYVFSYGFVDALGSWFARSFPMGDQPWFAIREWYNGHHPYYWWEAVCNVPSWLCFLLVFIALARYLNKPDASETPQPSSSS